MILKNQVVLFFLCLTAVSNKFGENKAYGIYNQNLKVIKARLDNKPRQSVAKINAAIDFFEEVTGIQSHSDGNYIGRYSPTKEDYLSWKKWLKKNKSRLYWDDNKVKVRPLKSPT